MGRKRILLAAVAGLVALSGASVAAAHCRPVHVVRTVCHCVRHVRMVHHVRYVHRVRRVERTIVEAYAPPPAPPPIEDDSVHLPASFFADSGGVGPAFIDSGGSSGGFAVVSAGASARAFASASASVSVAFRGHGNHMPPMKMMPHGHKW